MADELLIRIPEVARRLGLSRSTVYSHVMTGNIPSVSIGRSRRVPAAALAEWVDAQMTDPTDETRVPVEPDSGHRPKSTRS